MRTTFGLCAVVSVTAIVAPAAAQQDVQGNVVLIHCVDPQPGGLVKLEQGLKNHYNWHKEQKDTWGWATWVVMSGPQTDRFCTGTFGHKWEDFDKPSVSAEADRADAMANIAPFAMSHEATFWRALPDVSRPAAEPTPMNSVVFVRIGVGMERDFEALIGEYHRAIEKTGMPWRYVWYALVSGGDGGTYAVVLPRASFASFNPSGKPFDEMLADAYGKTAGAALDARWDAMVTGTETQLVVSRPDLGYEPNP